MMFDCDIETMSFSCKGHTQMMPKPCMCKVIFPEDCHVWVAGEQVCLRPGQAGRQTPHPRPGPPLLQLQLRIQGGGHHHHRGRVRAENEKIFFSYCSNIFPRTVIACWHPPPKFPYELSRPIPREETVSTSPLKVRP